MKNFPSSPVRLIAIVTLCVFSWDQIVFAENVAQNEFVGSMSRKGDCWDNAVAESFFHTLKVELIHRNKFRTRDEAKRRIFEYVKMYYNRRRAHSTLGYLSPFEYEKQLK